MLTSSFLAPTVAATSPRSLPTAPLALLLGIAIAALAGCAEEGTAPKPQAPAAPAPAAPAGPPPVVPFEQAVLNAANAVFTQAKAQAGSTPNAKLPVVIDPLVDGMTGAQSTATQQIQTRIM